MNYYNDSDPKICAWAKELIKEGLVPDGEVDCRSISDVQPEDLVGFTQCHFFCGILGWPYALRLAGWPDDRPVWTGSCPCQPYSNAGKGEGDKDPRNLWPEMFRLVRECRPDIVFGEQVESAIRHGWLDGISADLEREIYAVGHCVLGAHSVGAPHIRQRLYWLANSASSSRAQQLGEPGGGSRRKAGPSNSAEYSRFDSGGMGNTIVPRLEGHAGDVGDGNQPGRLAQNAARSVAETGGNSWSDYILVPCRDGKARRIKPGIEPLASGVSGRVGLLRGYGNSIVPQVAAEFITAYLECKSLNPQPQGTTHAENR